MDPSPSNSSSNPSDEESNSGSVSSNKSESLTEPTEFSSNQSECEGSDANEGSEASTLLVKPINDPKPADSNEPSSSGTSEQTDKPRVTDSTKISLDNTGSGSQPPVASESSLNPDDTSTVFPGDTSDSVTEQIATSVPNPNEETSPITDSSNLASPVGEGDPSTVIPEGASDVVVSEQIATSVPNPNEETSPITDSSNLASPVGEGDPSTVIPEGTSEVVVSEQIVTTVPNPNEGRISSLPGPSGLQPAVVESHSITSPFLGPSCSHHAVGAGHSSSRGNATNVVGTQVASFAQNQSGQAAAPNPGLCNGAPGYISPVHVIIRENTRFVPYYPDLPTCFNTRGRNMELNFVAPDAIEHNLQPPSPARVTWNRPRNQPHNQPHSFIYIQEGFQCLPDVRRDPRVYDVPQEEGYQLLPNIRGDPRVYDVPQEEDDQLLPNIGGDPRVYDASQNNNDGNQDIVPREQSHQGYSLTCKILVAGTVVIIITTFVALFIAEDLLGIFKPPRKN